MASKSSLLSEPLELRGDWGGSLPESARLVVMRMRQACLDGVRLLSDRQPQTLWVDNHFDGPPSIWLHSDPAATAWVIVDIDPRDWCKLAYQFGHELGHVLANSWNRAAAPHPPCQWLEEAMVEAFSIRGLAPLANEWERNPPFPDDSAFAGAIRQYRADLIERYRKAGDEPHFDGLAAWFAANRATLDAAGSLSVSLGPAVIAVLATLEESVACVEDLGALNRWPERSALPIEDYLRKWQSSCAEIGAGGKLPEQMRIGLGIA
ncbi:MAG: hypothetical protein E7774_16225 [Bradyrhizobium sp.]|nr:MAG: hypothetical protein E7774_16225 [Bradyrhizobium sp.]